MINLYEHFGCVTKEELYDLVKNDDKTVRSLVDFFDYSKGEIKNPNLTVSSPESFASFISDIKMPAENEAILVFVTTKNQPIHLGRIDLNDDDSLKHCLRESLNAESVSLFLLYDEGTRREHIKNIDRYFSTFSMEVIDSFEYDREVNSIMSNKGGYSCRLEDYVERVSDSKLGNTYLKTEDSIKQFQEYEAFTSYYAEQELIGLNIFEDNELVKENLKIGFQDNWQESFGVVLCDANGQVLSVNELFKGTTGSSLIDGKVITKELLSKEDASSVAVFHNHPSGQSEPSDADYRVTDNIKNMCERLDIKLLDHFVVAKENVYSFAKDLPAFVTFDERYHKAIDKKTIRSSPRIEHELEL